MVLNIIGFACGLCLLVYFRSVPPFVYCILLLALLTISYCLVPKGGSKRILLVIIWLTMGFSWNDWCAHQWLDKRISTNLVGKDISITGSIVSLPINNNLSSRFLFKTSEFAGQPQHLLLQLSWQNPHPLLTVGERWQLIVRLKPPHGLVNFNGFNKLRWFFEQNIHGTGYVRSQGIQHLLEHSKTYSIQVWRQSLQQEIFLAVKNPTAAAIIAALTMGVENGLSDQDWQILRDTGTVHLVVIAGLHIGLVSLAVSFLVKQGWRCFPWLLLRYPAQQAAAIAGLVVAVGYGALAGFGIPTQRAVIMIFILTLTQVFYFEASVWRRILIAFLIVIIVQPGALFAAGFWLSFGAVAWIAYSLGDQWRVAPHWQQWLRLQWGLFLGLMPLTLYFFQQFSLVSLLANLPAILWIGWVVVPICLLAAVTRVLDFSLSQSLFKLAGLLLMPLWDFLQWLSHWYWASSHHYIAYLWMVILALAGGVWCLAPANFPARWLGMLGFLPIWLVHPSRPAPGCVWLTMLDVGQGLAMVVQTAHHVLVYDTGARVPQIFDAGQAVILPYLQTLAFKKLDLLIISHGDNDHSGGAETLLNQWPVQKVLTSIPAKFAKFHAEFCQAGQHWQWDGVAFQLLAPKNIHLYQDNNSSCVLQFSVAGAQILMTGDIESPIEKKLVEEYGRQLQSTILVAPHHGSRTSSTLAFLQNVQPRFALFSLGYFNRFHFPAPSVVARYQQLGAQQLLTAKDGAVSIHISAHGTIEIETANSHRYFWQ